MIAEDRDVKKWSVFQRKDTKRWVLEYVPPGLSWDRAGKQVTAPREITSEARARAWAKGKLAEIRANGGTLTATRAGMHSLRELHVELMKVRAGLPDIKPASIKNNWTHLNAQILGISVARRPSLSDSPDAVRLRERRAKEGAGPKVARRKPDPIADIPMAHVDVAEARAFVRRIRARNSPNHTRNIFATARALWDVAIAEKKITTLNPFRNPLVVVEVPAARNLHVLDGQLDPITLPLHVVQELLDAPSSVVPLERRVRYALAFTGGFDDGELAGFTWGHRREGVPIIPTAAEKRPTLLARYPYLEVRQALSLRGRNGYATVDTPKTENRNRDLPLHPAAIAALEEWRDAWEQLVCRKPKPADFIFVRENGASWRPPSAALLRVDLRSLNRLMKARGRKPLLEEEKIAEVTFKAARRTFSSALKQANVDEEDRGRLMGHGGGSVTSRNYTAHELERLAGFVARIPLRWPLRNPLRRGIDPAGGAATTSTPKGASDVMKEAEARIGFEPTYDGFAIGGDTLPPHDSDRPHEDKGGASSPTSVGHSSPDGRAQGPDFHARRGLDPQGEGPGLARVPRGAEGVRVEVDGRVVARTDTEPGELVEDVEARLKLAAGQRGGIS